jgi:hypothetical protein
MPMQYGAVSPSPVLGHRSLLEDSSSCDEDRRESAGVAETSRNATHGEPNEVCKLIPLRFHRRGAKLRQEAHLDAREGIKVWRALLK